MAYIGKNLVGVLREGKTIATMTGDGSDTTLTLNDSPGSVNNVLIFIDGIRQMPGTDYTCADKTVTFTTAPETGCVVVAVVGNHSGINPKRDSVTTPKIVDGAVTNAKISSVASSDITGSTLPAMDASGLTGMSSITKSASDPTATANVTLGTVWANTTSGEMYICTGEVTNNNVWTNVGAGTGGIIPNDLPTNPTNALNSFPASHTESSSYTFTFTGATDSDGSVTHYRVDTISNSALTVSSAEVAAGQPHTFNTGPVNSDQTGITFRVRAKDNLGGYSSGVTFTTSVTNLVYIAANGGAVSTFGDYKIHAFTSTSSFNVTAVPASGNTTIEYLVVAGGGAGAAKASGGGMGGGGGAGGLREGSATASVQSYTATVGAGQSGNNGSFWGSTVPIGSPANAESSVHPTHQGQNSTFNSITSTGGGEGGMYASFPGTVGGSGGGGGGAHSGVSAVAGGAGNTPSTSPSQGNNGGTGNTTFDAAGGGGAGGVGQNPPNANNGGAGGVGKDLSAKFGTSLGDSGWFAGGGGGSHYTDTGAVAAGGQGGGAQGSFDTLNQNGDSGTGGGGGGVDGQGNASMIGGNGGSGIVLVRYKFQN